jgi:hypothetical protein
MTGSAVPGFMIMMDSGPLFIRSPIAGTFVLALSNLGALLHERNYTRISDFAAMRMNRLSITWVKMIAISNQVNPHQVKNCNQNV